MKDIKHLVNVAITFVVVITGFLVVRSFFVPESYGRIGRYRADAIDEIKALPLRYAGQQDCVVCHEDRVKEKGKGAHKKMSCESCHGAAKAHVDAPADVKPPRPATSRDYCGRCHSYNISRPKSFPQVKLDTHNTDAECTMCHDPHDPSI